VQETRIRSLAVMARRLGHSARLETMVECAAEETASALQAASVSVSRLEPGTGMVRTLINVGTLGPHEQRWPHDEVYSSEEFAQLNAVLSELRVWTASLRDPKSDAQEIKLLEELDKSSSLGAPIVVDGVLWGELYATRTIDAPAFAVGDTVYVEALSAILAGAVSRALHVAHLERLAYGDALTGLANRRALDEATTSAMSSGLRRSGRTVAVVIFDVNGLKVVNDSHGHAEGDRVLCTVASLLTRHFRTLRGSLVARLGGDEFAVLVTGYDVKSVVATAEAICAEASSLPYGAGLACGVAVARTRPGDPRTARELFLSADAAQYRAKRLGRSATVLADHVDSY
jgi:diguanylate cyclase (GGDEF)-like protein